MNSQHILQSDSPSEYLFNTWLTTSGLANSFTRKRADYICSSREEFYSYLVSIQENVQVVHLPYNKGVLYFGNGFCSYYVNSGSLELDIYGDSEEIEELVKLFSTRFSIADSSIEWLYNARGDSITVPLLDERKPTIEAYPFLETDSLADYYDSFIRSRSNILVLVGPPGTGKTTFIRGLIQHWKTTALVTYDTALLNTDNAFVSFLEGDANLMILEDADTFITSREETGNTMMHRFLNIGDGLISNASKKLVFSTNITDMSIVDPALIRPGRCFDILNFRLLTLEEAQNLCPSFKSDKTEIALAEVYQFMNSGSLVTTAKKQGKKQKAGFY